MSLNSPPADVEGGRYGRCEGESGEGRGKGGNPSAGGLPPGVQACQGYNTGLNNVMHRIIMGLCRKLPALKT